MRHRHTSGGAARHEAPAGAGVRAPRRATRTGLLAVGVAALAAAFAAGGGTAYAQDSSYECSGQPPNTVLRINHSTGAITTFTSPGALQAAITAASGSSGTASGSGDTVMACPGTYAGPINIPAGTKDGITVRSAFGPNNVFVVGDGTSTPVVDIGASGVTFGGPAEGLTITDIAPVSGATELVGIQLGVRGAQSTMNEDEQCFTLGVATGSGCDKSPPSQVPINDWVDDNVVTGLVPQNHAFAGTVTGIELDNTINSTVQSNRISKAVADHSSVGTFNGIVIGTLDQASGAGSSPDFTTGDSTNINAAALNNAVVQAVANGCTKATGITLNGFVLDAILYTNLVQSLANDNGHCATTGIFSNAYGSLENEQTGTLAPTNANIDDNLIGQLNNNHPTNSTAIYLAPHPTSATPQPPAPPTGCLQGGMPCPPDNLPPSSYTVISNELQQVYKAVDVEAVLGSNSYIKDDNFDGDAIGVTNGTMVSQDTNLDATNHWWGCELPGTSPPPAAPGPGGCAALVSPAGDTSWAPTQTNRVEDTGDEAGQGAGST